MSYYFVAHAAGTYRWYKPSNAKVIKVLLWGAGGGGMIATAGVDSGDNAGCGGGGGSHVMQYFDAVYIPRWVVITVGRGGTGGSTGSAGGNTTFGSYLTAYGGGGGGTNAGAGAGTGGLVLPSVGATGGVNGGQGTIYETGGAYWSPSSYAEYGGGSGRGNTRGGVPLTGGGSINGGCGGGGGGFLGLAGGAGGAFRYWGRGGGGAGGAAGNPPSNGSSVSGTWGGGGGGGASSISSTGGRGGNGGYASGGGGGGCRSGQGGTGGPGVAMVIVYW